jgi:hypothetical protein
VAEQTKLCACVQAFTVLMLDRETMSSPLLNSKVCLAHSLHRCQSESTTLYPNFIKQPIDILLSSSDFSYKLHKHMNYSDLSSNIDIKCTIERASHALCLLCRPSSSTLNPDLCKVHHYQEN